MWYKNQNHRRWFRRIMVKFKKSLFSTFSKNQGNLPFSRRFGKYSFKNFFFEKLKMSKVYFFKIHFISFFISEAKFPFLVQCGSCEAVSIYVEVLLLFHPFLCHSESESQPRRWGRRTPLSGLTFTVLNVPLEEMKYRVSPFPYFRLPIIVSHFQFFRRKFIVYKSCVEPAL